MYIYLDVYICVCIRVCVSIHMCKQQLVVEIRDTMCVSTLFM